MYFIRPNCHSNASSNLSLLESIELYSFWDTVDPEKWEIKTIEAFLLERFDIFIRRDIREKGKSSKPVYHDSSISSRSLTYRSLDYRRKSIKHKFDRTRTYLDSQIDWSDRSAISNVMLPLTPHEHIKHAYDLSLNFTQHTSHISSKYFKPTFRNLKYWLFLLVYHSDFLKNDYDIFIIGNLYAYLDRWHVINGNNFASSKDKKFLDGWLASHPWESTEDMNQYISNIARGGFEQVPSNWDLWGKHTHFMLPSHYTDSNPNNLESDPQPVAVEPTYVSISNESSNLEESTTFICQACGHHNPNSLQTSELSLDFSNMPIDPPFYEEAIRGEDDIIQRYIPGEGWISS